MSSDSDAGHSTVEECDRGDRAVEGSDEGDISVEGSEEYFDESEHVDGCCPEGSDFAAEEGYEEVWDEVQEALSTMGHEEFDETAESDLCARSQASRPSSASSQASVLS